MQIAENSIRFAARYKYFLDELMDLMDLQERDELISYLNNSVHWRRALSEKFGERPLS